MVDYMTQRSDPEQVVAALECVIAIPTGAGEEAASALQKAEVLSVASDARQGSRLAFSDDEDGAVPEENRQFCRSFRG